tara:strand:- start:210 stop:368 length:159 start_codon:yes stop_codon:yes gene_type:complete
MRQPDYTKMKLRLCKNQSPETQESINKLNDDDVMYEFIKTYSIREIPKKEIL